MERQEREGSKGKPSISRLLIVLILIVIIAPIIASFLFLYYLPSNDVEATVYRSYPLTEDVGIELSYIAIRVNVTNNGVISHYVGLTGKVVFNSQPDEVYTKTSYYFINPGETLNWVFIYVDVPDEIVLEPHDASCSITLPSPVNQCKYNIGWIVLVAIIWVVTLAFLSVTLVRSRRR